MPIYKHPGVYIEHVPSGLLAIEAASTSVAAFIGPVRRGTVGKPEFITSVSQFAQQFGTLNDGTNGIRDEGDTADKFGNAVNAFFGNGGNKAYIIRVAETSGAGAPKAATSAIPNPESNTTGFLLTAKSEGVWANDMIARLSTTDKSAVPDVELGYTLELGVLADGKFQALEGFTGLQMDPASARSIEKVVTEQSTLASLAPSNIGTDPGEIQVVSKALQGVATALPASLDLAGKKLDIKIGDSPKFSVEFAEDSDNANAIAAIIQSAARADPGGSPEFTVTVSGGNTFRLASKIAGPAGNVTAPSGTARTAPRPRRRDDRGRRPGRRAANGNIDRRGLLRWRNGWRGGAGQVGLRHGVRDDPGLPRHFDHLAARQGMDRGRRQFGDRGRHHPFRIHAEPHGDRRPPRADRQ